MPAKSKIKELDNRLIKHINKLMFEGKLSLDDIKEFIANSKLNKNNVSISRSALGRYKQKLEELTRDFQQLEEFMSAVGKDIGFDKESELHKLIYKILSKAILDNSLSDTALDSKQVMFLAKALKDLISSTKDRAKLRAEIEIEMIEKIKVETIAKAENLGFQGSSMELIREAFKD